MKSIRHLIILSLVVLAICLGLTVIGYLWYQAEVVRPYEEFMLAEKETIPLFDAMNEDVYQSLPPLPPNSSLQGRGAIGILSPLYEHGRWLRIKVSTNQTKDFILKYYDSLCICSITCIYALYL